MVLIVRIVIIIFLKEEVVTNLSNQKMKVIITTITVTTILESILQYMIDLLQIKDEEEVIIIITNTEVVNADMNQQIIIQMQIIVTMIIEIFLEIAYTTIYLIFILNNNIIDMEILINITYMNTINVLLKEKDTVITV